MTDRKKDRSEILDKVRKLLAMAADVGSPNEAAIAARQAKKLMDAYNIEHAEVLTSELSRDDMAEQLYGDAYKHFPVWMSILSVAVANYTECRALFMRAGPVDVTVPKHQREKRLCFRGERDDLELCKYLYEYLRSTANRLTKAQGFRYVGPRTAYLRGFSSAIAKRLKEMKAKDTDEALSTHGKNALVLVGKKVALLDEKFGKTNYSNTSYDMSGREQAFAAGHRDGSSIGIHGALNDGRNTKRLVRM